MFSKAKMGMLLGTMAAVFSLGTLSSAYAANVDQTKTVNTSTEAGQAKGWFGKGHVEHRGFGAGIALKDNADLLALLKLDAEKLGEELKAGKSLADVAKAQGVDEDDVIALLVKQQEEKLAEAVKAGKLTQEQADKVKEKASEHVKALVESTHEGRGPGFGFGGFEKNEDLLALLKLDADKLKEELKAGKSLADVAKAQGVDEDDVIALLVKQEEEKLAEAVKAGKLTQEQADKVKEKASEHVKALVENTHQGKGFHFGFGLGKNEELLSLLNLDETKLKEALKAGKSLADLAKEQGVDADDVIALLVKQQEEKLAEAVKAGKLTQEEADKRSEEWEAVAKKIVEGTFEKVILPKKGEEQTEQTQSEQ